MDCCKEIIYYNELSLNYLLVLLIKLLIRTTEKKNETKNVLFSF